MTYLSYSRVIFRAIGCAALVGTLILSACSGVPCQNPQTPQEERDASTLSSDAQITLQHLTMSEALDRGDTKSALNALDELIKLAPTPELYIQKIKLFNQSGSTDKALEAAHHSTMQYPDNLYLKIVWAELLQQAGQNEQALDVLNSACRRYIAMNAAARREHQDEINNTRQFTVYILLNSRRFDETEKYLQTVPPRELTPTLLFYEIVLLRNQDKEREATGKLYDLVKNYPDFIDGWLTLASDMEKGGDYKNAVRFYNKALELAPVTEIYLRMLGAQIKAGNVRAAQSQVMAAPFSAEVKIRAAIIFIDAKEYKAARGILLTLKNDPFAADDVAMYLAMISYDTDENVKESLDRLRDISPDAPNRQQMIYIKALLHIRDNNYPEALQATRTLRDEYPENKEHWTFLAELANVSKNYKFAESVSREALEQWPEDISIMYSLAMSLAMQKKNSQAIQLLNDILMLDESNVMAMNSLAYTLAEEKRDLKRALALAHEALSRQPENTSIMDTLAWVHYQLGNHDEAWKIMKQCVAKGVDDAIIWDHYGDIAQAVGDGARARAGYLRALELEPENQAEILKKLKNLK